MYTSESLYLLSVESNLPNLSLSRLPIEREMKHEKKHEKIEHFRIFYFSFTFCIDLEAQKVKRAVIQTSVARLSVHFISAFPYFEAWLGGKDAEREKELVSVPK